MARSFNGTSDLIAADGAAIGAFTVAFAIALRCKGSPQNNMWLWGEGSSSSNNQLFGFNTGASTASANLLLRSDTNTVAVNYTTVAAVFDATWHHIAYTQDGSGNWKVYVDGALDGSGTHSTSLGLTVNRRTIGALRRASTGNWFAGSIAEVAGGRASVSAPQIASLANGLPASHLGLDHYWPLWGADSPEPDIGTATHVSGTLTGTTRANGARVGRRLLTLA